jgi:hypothetical protein
MLDRAETFKQMSNVRTISQEDLDKYPSLKGRQVGDVLTAEEDYQLRKEYAEQNGEQAPQAINPDTGVTGTPSSVNGDESEADETAATRRSRASRSR